MVAIATPALLSAAQATASTAAAVAALRQGRFALVVDDAGREGEGDLVMAAQFATTESVALLLGHSSGVICVAMDSARCDQLDLAPMVARNTAPLQTAFTVSVDAARGIGTGISAADRAHTIRVLGDPSSGPTDFVRPGHMFPLRAAAGGVRERPGHTEACVELARLADLPAAMVLCEVTSPDRRRMADAEDLRRLAEEYDVPILRIADLAVALEQGGLGPVRTATARLPTRYGTMTAHAYRSAAGVEHLALVHGDVLADRGPMPVRVHSECLTGDVLGSLRCDCGAQLDLAMRTIVDEGRGVVIYLGGQEGRGIGLASKIAAYAMQDGGMDTVDANTALGLPVDDRCYADAARILFDLGLRRVTLLTNNPDKERALRESGLAVTRQPLPVAVSSENHRYLRTKATRLGHDLPHVLAAVG